MRKIWFIIRSKLPGGRGFIEAQAKKESEAAKTNKYITFEEFLQNCPEYQINDGFMANLIRNIYRSVGVRFQQYVFIDKTSSEDKAVWLRKEKDKVIHEKGTYFLPWKSDKKIVYYDVIDSRPLIDMTDEMDWRNGDMCADVVTAVTNSNNMMDLRGEQEPKSNPYLLAIIGIGILSLIAIYYSMQQMNTNQAQIVEILKIIQNQTTTYYP